MSSLLHKLLNMKEGAPSPQLAGDISPSITLESDRPEWKFLAGVRMVGCTLVQALNAAQPAQILIRNPLGTNVIAVLSDFLLSVTAAANDGFVLNLMVDPGANLTTLRQGTPLDTRWGITQGQHALVVSSTATVAALAGSPIDSQYAPIGFGPQPSRMEVVLTPGFALYIRTDSANMGLRGSCRWYERAVESSETR